MKGFANLRKAITGGPDWEIVELIKACLSNSDKVYTRNANRNRLFMHPVCFTNTPLVSLRSTAWKTALREMEWFLSGSTKLEDAHPGVQKWWKDYAEKYMDGNSYILFNYGQQFRASEGIMESEFDQLSYLIEGIKHHPYSTRNVITLWNTADMANPECPITNCHGTVIQAYVDSKTNDLSLSMYQRSADVVCGVPHNWIQYWAFLLYLAHHTGRGVGELYWLGGDCHVYEQHDRIARAMADTKAETLDSINTPQLNYVPPADLPCYTIHGSTAPGTIPVFRATDFELDREYRPLMTDSVEMVV